MPNQNQQILQYLVKVKETEGQILIHKFEIISSIASDQDKKKKNITKCRSSELEAMLPSCISKCFNASMVWITTAIKRNLYNSFLQTGLGYEFPHLLCYFLELTKKKF